MRTPKALGRMLQRLNSKNTPSLRQQARNSMEERIGSICKSGRDLTKKTVAKRLLGSAISTYGKLGRKTLGDLAREVAASNYQRCSHLEIQTTGLSL